MKESRGVREGSGKTDRLGRLPLTEEDKRADLALAQIDLTPL